MKALYRVGDILTSQANVGPVRRGMQVIVMLVVKKDSFSEPYYRVRPLDRDDNQSAFISQSNLSRQQELL